MKIARGDQATLMARYQTNSQAPFKTPEDPGAGLFKVLPFYTYDVRGSEEQSEDNAVSGLGGNAYPRDVVRGIQGAGGTFTVPLGVQSFGHHLTAFLGDPATTDDTNGNYTHVFTTPAVQVPKFTNASIVFNDTGHKFETIGLTYTQTTLNLVKNGERARADFQVIGFNDKPLETVKDTAPVAFANDSVPVNFQSLIRRQGALAGDVTSLQVTLTSGIEPDNEAMNGLPSPERVLEGRWGISVSLTARFEDRGWYDLADQGTKFDIDCESVVASGDNPQSHAIKLHNIVLERTGIPVPGDGNISVTYTGRAAAPSLPTAPFTWTIKNQTPNYANLTA